MIDKFIENFRQKHGFNRHTAMLLYNDEDDSDGEPIDLEGGQKMVIWRRIISPDEASTPEEDPDKLEDLGAQPKKHPAPEPEEGQGGSMGPPPGKKSKKAAESGEPSKTPRTGDPGPTPQLGEQDPTPGSALGPTPTPRPSDTDPLEGDTPPLRPEGEPMPLGTDPGQADVREIPLPPRPPPPPASTNSTRRRDRPTPPAGI